MSDADGMNEMDVVIHDVAFGGSGVGRLPDGKVVFVPRALMGEKVRIQLARSRKDFSQGELVEVLQPSPHRVAAPCVYFGRCGGCQYQHAAYEEQLRIKEKQVRDTLQRIGGFKELPEVVMHPAPQPYGYRNKISLHSGMQGEIGFFAADHRTVVDIERCLISNEPLNAQLASLRKSRSRPRHVSLVDQRSRGSPEGSFHQVNTEMATHLLGWLHRQVPSERSDALFDLYCGAGFFALGLADRFARVCGMDRDPEAIHAATARARAAGAAAAQFLAAPVEERIDWLLRDEALSQSTILVDPPREGLPAQVLEVLAKRKAARLVYVSCNPATLARDLKRLVSTGPDGYAFRRLGVFDMFPQTAHIEAAAILEPQ